MCGGEQGAPGADLGDVRVVGVLLYRQAGRDEDVSRHRQPDPQRLLLGEPGAAAAAGAAAVVAAADAAGVHRRAAEGPAVAAQARAAARVRRREVRARARPAADAAGVRGGAAVEGAVAAEALAATARGRARAVDAAMLGGAPCTGGRFWGETGVVECSGAL